MQITTSIISPEKPMNHSTPLPSVSYRPGRQLGLIATLVVEVSAASINAAVLPPEQSYAGKTYPEWMASSWIAAWSRPQVGGADMRDGSSPVWYLWGLTTTPSTAHIRVPDDKALFVTLDGIGTSTVEPYPYDGQDETELLKNVTTRFQLTPRYCEIDGMLVSDLDQFEFVSPLFDFHYPSPNIGGVPGSGWGSGVGRGHSILVHSLEPGLHTIGFQSDLGFENQNARIEATYQITVYTRPSISIRPIPGTDEFELSWPATVGFELQETEDVGSAASWTRAAVVSSRLDNGVMFATVEKAPSRRFYRLTAN